MPTKVTAQLADSQALDGLGQLLPLLAEQWPERAALVTDSRTLTYRDLERLANDVAHGLAARGVRPGDRVALLSQNRWEWIASYHGALRCGAVVNPLNVMLTGQELAYILTDSGAKMLMAAGDCRRRPAGRSCVACSASRRPGPSSRPRASSLVHRSDEDGTGFTVRARIPL